MNQTPSTAASIPATPGIARLEELETGVMLLRLGSQDERVVTLTPQRIQSIRECLAQVKSKKPKGLIITGPGQDMFTAGADIGMIRDVSDPLVGEKFAREGQTLFDEIESFTFPTVAAISGPCVGGGCELVLACRYRIITDQRSSTIGLPEVKLGIIPGFGGTQRLPRLVGLPKALDIILGGKTLKPKQALACGLVNEIVSWHKLIERADMVASGFTKGKAPQVKFLDKLLTRYSFGRNMVRKKATIALKKETRGFYPAPPAALESVFTGLERGMQEGLKFEAKELGRMIVTSESKSLVRIFFLSEASKGLGRSARKTVEHLHAVVIGAGVMGAGIAGLMARNECSVILKDTTEEAVNRGMNQIRQSLSKVKYLSDSERSFIVNRVEATTRDSENLGNANFCIEAIFEDLEVKRKVLGDLSNLIPQDAIIATNTSSLSVTKIAETIQKPERVIGMHFFNPVEKMPLVEIIRGSQTSDRAIAVIAALASKMGKFPIVVQDVPGFLVNRILSPYLNEAAWMIADGFKISDIDKAALNFGMPMGPVRLLDEVGLDVASHVSDIMFKGYGERMKGPSFASTLVSAGRKGKKSNAGFYDFVSSADKKTEEVPHPNIRTLLKIERPERVAPDLSSLSERLVLTLVNEAVRCLDEGVAGAPGKEAAGQIDLGTVMGMGFPPFRGGLMHYADSLGVKTVLEKLRALAKEHGVRFAPADGIRIRAEKGKSFLDAI